MYLQDNEFSGSESVLSDVYADFLNEAEVEDELAGQAHTSVDLGGSGEHVNTKEKSSEAPLTDVCAFPDTCGHVR
jgi:hypothetical protein